MELANLLIGVGSFIVTALPLFIQGVGYLRTKSKYETLQNLFERRSKDLIKLAKNNEDSWTRILTLLEVGDELMPYVRQRLMGRFVILLTVAFGSGTLAGISPAFEMAPRLRISLGAFVLLTNWVLQFILFSRHKLLSPQEQAFIRNIRILQDTFYNKIVVDLMEIFNRRCDETLKQENDDFQAELKRLNAQFKELVPSFTTNSLAAKALKAD
jgi:hypothetical protein